jgi:prolyl-tRNA editing enzyme YbaK/EbsC (Cys-tRNA(Pro) deacylase)
MKKQSGAIYLNRFPWPKPNSCGRTPTGFAIGGVPPIGHLNPLKTFIDEDLFQFEEIWAAAGTPHAVFKLTPDELKKITNGEVISVK